MNKSDLTPDTLQLVRVADALQRFPELENRLHSDNSIDDEVIVFEGDTWLTCDLSLDFSADSWPESEQGSEVLGLICTGDLVVDGAIVNYDIDCSPFLIVLGNLQARTIDKGASIIDIAGNCHVEHVIYGYYNHGGLHVGGTIQAKYLISEDHTITGHIHPDTTTINNFDDRGAFTYYIDDLPDIVVPELYNQDEECLDVSLFMQYVAEGRPLLQAEISRTELPHQKT